MSRPEHDLRQQTPMPPEPAGPDITLPEGGGPQVPLRTSEASSTAATPTGAWFDADDLLGATSDWSPAGAGEPAVAPTPPPPPVAGILLATTPAATAPASAPTMATATMPDRPASTTATPTIVNEVVVDMAPVERVLSGLRGAIEEAIRRPQPTLDMQLLMAAIDRSVGRVRDLHERSDANLPEPPTGRPVTVPGPALAPPAFVVPRGNRTPTVMLAVGFLLACWAVVFWFKTGNPKLALGTLVVGNLVGCCVLGARRD